MWSGMGNGALRRVMDGTGDGTDGNGDGDGDGVGDRGVNAIVSGIAVLGVVSLVTAVSRGRACRCRHASALRTHCRLSDTLPP